MTELIGMLQEKNITPENEFQSETLQLTEESDHVQMVSMFL